MLSSFSFSYIQQINSNFVRTRICLIPRLALNHGSSGFQTSVYIIITQGAWEIFRFLNKFPRYSASRNTVQMLEYTLLTNIKIYFFSRSSAYLTSTLLYWLMVKHEKGTRSAYNSREKANWNLVLQVPLASIRDRPSSLGENSKGTRKT